MARHLVTGAAGFIGHHVARALLARGDEVVGVDSFVPYYDLRLKEARFSRIAEFDACTALRGDLANESVLSDIESRGPFDAVIHLAAQAGVRWSIDHPHEYVHANLAAFVHVLELCRRIRPGHTLFASSSSVYGASATRPYREERGADHPVSLYAATKRANELIAHSYAHLYSLPLTGLRFFTVYGPWGRPDMAYYKFTDAILAGRAIDVYAGGKLRRDFTYVDDVVDALVRMIDLPPRGDPDWDPHAPDPSSSAAPFRIANVGGEAPVEVDVLIATLERLLGRRAIRRELPMQPGDVVETAADTTKLVALLGFRPATPLETGLARFVEWYRDYHNV